MNGIRGIVFDCDGVLFESRKANLEYYNTLLAYFDKPPVDETDHANAHICHTAASPQVLQHLLGEKRVPQALSIAAQLDYRQFIPYMEPEPGIREALAALTELFPLAIATNRGDSMPGILEHFGLTRYFATVVTSRDVHRPKPAPDMLFEAAKRMQLAPQELLFVGDSELDQAAANAAGMQFAAYRGNLQADLSLENHAQLVSLFINA